MTADLLFTVIVSGLVGYMAGVLHVFYDTTAARREGTEMTWCERCDRSTLEICSGNHCRRCCRDNHGAGECDRFDGEWATAADRAARDED